MGNLSAADLARLVALEKAATPGEWHVQSEGGAFDAPIYAICAKTFAVARTTFRAHSEGSSADDAAFLVALRNAAPSLLAEVGRLREENERLSGRNVTALFAGLRVIRSSWIEPGTILVNAHDVPKWILRTAALSSSPEVPDER